MPHITISIFFRIFTNENQNPMKKTLTVLILLVCVHTGFAQWTREWSMGYVFTSPTGKMNQTINQGHGIALDFHMLAPSQKYSLGVDFNASIYGYDKSSQEYMFPDGTTAQMDVDVTNTFSNLMASGRYNLITGKSLTPYVSAKAGYA
jgi:hypothetical protein